LRFEGAFFLLFIHELFFGGLCNFFILEKVILTCIV
jgi:hypothetical protein